MYSFSVNSRNHLLKARNTEIPFFFDKKKKKNGLRILLVVK